MVDHDHGDRHQANDNIANSTTPVPPTDIAMPDRCGPEGGRQPDLSR
jgi:hypothetical protein